MEKWNSVSGFEGFFEVSDYGNVRSLTRQGKNNRVHKGKILTKYEMRDRKYLMVSLYNPNIQKTRSFSIHRLVLLAFKGMPPLGHVGCHNDGNARNNILSNLRWGTPQHNSDDARRHGTLLFGERCEHSKLTWEQASQIRESEEITSELAKRFGVKPDTIRCIRRGRTWKVASFVRKKVDSSAKLTEDDVRFIRKSSDSSRDLAKKFGVDYSTVRNVIKYKTWKNIHEQSNN